MRTDRYEAPRSATKVNYYRAGIGSPLVLIHGIGHRWQAWEPVLDELARHHDVIAIDLPGFGQSPMPADAISGDMSVAVERVTAFLTCLGVECPHVAGNSLGGAIALELAAADRAASATAFSPAGFFTSIGRRRALAILRGMRANAFLPTPMIRVALRSRRVRALTFGPIVAHPSRLTLDRMVGDALALRRSRGFGPTARAVQHYQFNGQPAVPVTVAWAEKDRILPLAQADVARARLPKATHLTLPGCGHVPMSDDPDRVADVILATTHAA